MRITGLTVHPVKAMSGTPTQRATVTPLGLSGDRRWVLLDGDGHRVNAVTCHDLLGLRAAPTPTGVRITDRSGESLDVPTPGPDAPTTATRMSRIDTLTLADPAAGAWVSERVGRPLRLAFQAEHQHREIGASHGGRPGELMSLNDAGPVHLVTEASTDRVRDLVAQESGEAWLDRPAAVERFRPSVLVDGTEPFAEDDWGRVRIGDVTYRFGELCDRCVVTTIDRSTLATTKEPIRTLARHRAWDGATWFGIRLIPELPAGVTGTIAVGDDVEVLSARS